MTRASINHERKGKTKKWFVFEMQKKTAVKKWSAHNLENGRDAWQPIKISKDQTGVSQPITCL